MGGSQPPNEPQHTVILGPPVGHTVLLRELPGERQPQRSRACWPEIHGTRSAHALRGTFVPQLESGCAYGRGDTV